MAVPVDNEDNGMRWNTEGIQCYPEWTREPDIAAVARTAYEALRLTGEEIARSHTEYLTEGALNKIYRIICRDDKYIMRVSLPVDPINKTVSEVATLRTVGASTDIPVPTVIAWDASCNNAIGYEWILMEHMPGQPLEDIWDSLTWQVKLNIVAEVAKWMAQLFNVRFTTLGALRIHGKEDEELCSRNSSDAGSDGISVGPLVSHSFFRCNSQNVEAARGPFHSSRQWLLASSLLVQQSCQDVLLRQNQDKSLQSDEDVLQRQNQDQSVENAEGVSQRQNHDEDVENAEFVSQRHNQDATVDSAEEEKAKMTMKLLEDIRTEIDRNFPEESANESSALHHDDISLNNLLANDEGQLTALLDWEFVVTVPLYKTAYYPSFLVGPPSIDNERPQKEHYFHDEDGTVDDLYWINLRKYEETVLRPIFLQEIRKHSAE